VLVSQIENGLQTQKPILIEEFGETSGDAVSDQNTIGSPELQANVYQGVYQALKEMRSSQLIGAVAFDFYSRTQYPDAWAVVKNKGDYLFPAAYILQEYALGKNNPSLQKVTAVHSQSYLETNADNNSTETLHVSDRVGLKLQLDDSKTYSLSLSASGILKPAELFHHDPVSNSYYAVYQATSQGNIQINIIDDKHTIIYTLKINIR
jgi:predicted metalloendopeptidase